MSSLYSCNVPSISQPTGWTLVMNWLHLPKRLFQHRCPLRFHVKQQVCADWVLEEKGMWWEHKYHSDIHVGKSNHRIGHCRHLQNPQKYTRASLSHASNQSMKCLHINCAYIKDTNYCFYLKQICTCVQKMKGLEKLKTWLRKVLKSIFKHYFLSWQLSVIH